MKLKGLILSVLLLLGNTSFADTQTIRLLLDELSYNHDVQVRGQIVQTMRAYVSDEQVRRALMSTATDSRENLLVRSSAVKVLSKLADDATVAQAITTAHDRSSDIDFRATCLKALYKAADSNERIRSVMRQNLLQNHDIRIKMASAFGLMEAADHNDVEETLRQVVNAPFQNAEVRIEAIKSLYLARQNADTKQLLNSIAQNSMDNEAVRVAAVRLMTSYARGSRNRDFLIDLYNRAQRSSVRAAAMGSLKFEMSDKDVRWLHLPFDPRTNMERDPFDYE